MDTPLYWLARLLVAVLQKLTLRHVARLGRAGGQLAYWLDGRHRPVALRNLRMCFGSEKPPSPERKSQRVTGTPAMAGVKRVIVSDCRTPWLAT